MFLLTISNSNIRGCSKFKLSNEKNQYIFILDFFRQLWPEDPVSCFNNHFWRWSTNFRHFFPFQIVKIMIQIKTYRWSFWTSGQYTEADWKKGRERERAFDIIHIFGWKREEIFILIHPSTNKYETTQKRYGSQISVFFLSFKKPNPGIT